MISKKITYFSGLLVLILVGIVLLFFLKDAGEKPAKIEPETEPGKVLQSNEKIRESTDIDIPPSSSVPDKQERPQTGKWRGVILPGNPITLYAPEEGDLHLFVKSGDRVSRGDILAEITNPDLLKTTEKQKAIFEDEINQKHLQIESAQDDIIRIQGEISDIQVKILDAEQAHYNAQLDFDGGLIDEKTLNAKKEEYDRMNAHLEGAEQMLGVKHKEIGEYEGRIRELEATEKESPKGAVIEAPFDAVISTVFSLSGGPVEKTAPVIEINAQNVITLKVGGNIPLSLDQEKIFFAIENQLSVHHTGVLQIESVNYSRDGGEEETMIKIIPDASSQNISYEIDGKVVIWVP